MNDQERQVIDDIFRRLEQVANQPRDPEAERYITEKLRSQPYAPYAMAQAIFVQEQALANLNAEFEKLQAERSRSSQGGFLSGLFGGGARQPEPSPGSAWGRPAGPPVQQPYGMPQGGMMGGGPWGGMQRSGGGFLQSAMATAAGVAGGVMIANALSHAFGGEHGAGAADQASSIAGLGEQGGADAGGYGGITDGLYQDASADEEADYGGDGGDGGDWT
jgi:hypothetical protein